MSTSVTLFLVKFFTEESHADQFVNGNLFMNRLSYFKKLEGDDGRPDRREAVEHWLQPQQLRLKLKVPGIGEIELTGTDLSGPVLISPDFYNDLHLFCMTSVQISVNDGQTTLSEEDRPRVREEARVDPRCLSFGRFAVIVRTSPFLERVKTALVQSRLGSMAGKVEYFDGNQFHGSFTPDEAPFRKEKDYSYQNEFRITINNGTHGIDPLNFNVGDISDISYKLLSSEVNATFSTL